MEWDDDMSESKYVIAQDSKGYGVWYDELDWDECNALEYFITYHQAAKYVEEKGGIIC